MNTRDLEYVLAVAEHLHFGKAAEACHVSQPAMSAQLKKLEARLGVQIFERGTRGVSVTAAGEAIVAQAKRVLHESAQLVEVADALKNPLAGTLKLGVIPTLGPYILPRIMPALAAQLPDLNVLLFEWQTPRCVDGLLGGDLDAALLATEVDAPLIGEVYANEPFHLLVSRSDPLAVQDQVSADTIRQLPLMLLEEGHCLRDQALEVCSLEARAGEFYATSLETLRHMVAAGNGVTMVPELALQTWGDQAAAKAVAIRPTVSRALNLVYRKSTPRKALMQAIWQLLNDNVGEEWE